MYGKIQDKQNMKIEFKITSPVLVFLALDPEAESEASQRTEVVWASCCHVAYPVKKFYYAIFNNSQHTQSLFYKIKMYLIK